MLTADRVLELLHYDRETGCFTWKAPRSNRMKPGQAAGSPNDLGYVYLTIDGRKYRAHRVVWLLEHGEWPPFELDHDNRDRADNRIGNLVPSSRMHNMLNQRDVRKSNRLGITGVQRVPGGSKFCARFRGKHLGTFDTAAMAESAYLLAKETARADFCPPFAHEGGL